MKRTNLTALLGSALLAACTASNREVMAPQNSTFVSNMQAKHGCVGVGTSQYQSVVAREEDSNLNAKLDYAARCLRKKSSNTTIFGLQVWYHPGERVAVAYCPKEIKCDFVKE